MATWIFFGHFCKKKDLNIFLPKKSKNQKKKMRPPDWPQYQPPATPGNRFFLRLASALIGDSGQRATQYGQLNSSTGRLIGRCYQPVSHDNLCLECRRINHVTCKNLDLSSPAIHVLWETRRKTGAFPADSEGSIVTVGL